MNAAQLADLLRHLDEEARFHRRQSKTYRANSIGRMQHTSTEKLLREAAGELRALGGGDTCEGIDLCELAAEIERVRATKFIETVYAIAGERTDGYWSGHANACEEIKFRLQEEWSADPHGTSPAATVEG